ncbi:MAG: hypothetical protein KA165_09615 [Saprospiraceae bacterium]|nr:hypothetical protein [Saprospiraceae bacterium]
MNHALPCTQALGWAIVHSAWQIAAIWLIFRFLSWRLQRYNHAIYVLSLAAMLGSAVWAAATFAGEYRRLSVVEASGREISLPLQETVLSVEPAFSSRAGVLQNFPASAGGWIDEHAAELGWAWCICALLLYLRLLGGYWLAHRLRNKGVSAPAESHTLLCKAWAERLNISRYVQLLESPNISEPLTIGFWKPVILFPVGLLAQLSPAQVEVLLLHELAHIRRHDYLVNLFQLGLEVLFFYHPLFWLLSREARSRREYCCDDLVVRHTSDPILYASTLTNLQLSFLHVQNQFTMNATGKSNFTERILRIAGITPKRSMRSNWFAILLLPFFIALVSWWPVAANSDATDSSTTFNTENKAEEPNRQSAAQDTVPPRRAAAPSPADHTTPPPPPGPGDASTPAVSIKLPAASATEKNEHPNPTSGEPVSGEIAIQALNMNVFYIGVDNPLRIAASGVPAEEISVRFNGKGKMTGDHGKYIVQPAEPGAVTIQVFRVRNGTETLLGEQQYRVKRIPDPVPTVSGRKSQSIALPILLEAKGVNALLENFDFDAYCEVTGFEITVVSAKADATSIPVTGSDFPARVRELFKTLETEGGGVFIDDIKVKCPGDLNPRNVGGLAYKVKKTE